MDTQLPEVSQSEARPVQQTAEQAVNLEKQTERPDSKRRTNYVYIAAFVFFGLILAGIFGFIYTLKEFPYKGNTYSKTPSAIPSLIPSPIPTVDMTTDSALEDQSNKLDASLDNVDKTLNAVDEGLYDQQGDLSEF